MQNEVNEYIVRIAYKLILGREPESEEAIRSHLHCKTIDELRKVMMNSLEFKSKLSQIEFSSGSKWVAVEVLDRYIMWIDLHDRYVSYGCLHNDWEPSETSFFISKLCPGDTVLDIGANIGWFTLVAAKYVGVNGHVYAFEPRPETFRMLKRTIADNHLQQNVNVYPYALSDEPSHLKIVWSKNTDNPGSAFMTHGNNLDDSYETAEVSAVVLDEFLPYIAPDLIKIDVEGAEPKVLKGAKNTIMKKRPSILSEINPKQLELVSGVTPAQYISQLADYGYRCYMLENGKPTREITDYPSDINRDLINVVFEFSSTVK